MSSIIAGAHEGVIFSIMVCTDGSIVTGGGKDGLVKTWNLVQKSETAVQTVCVVALCMNTDIRSLVGPTSKNVTCGAVRNNEFSSLIFGPTCGARLD